MKKFFFLLLFSVPLSGKLLAQVGKEKTSFGRESIKGVVHAAALAKFLEEHPSKIMRRHPRKEEEEIDENTDLPGEADPSLIKTLKREAAFRQAQDGLAPAYMPVSVSPADSFQAVLSGGTNIPPDTHGAVDSNYAACAVNGVLKIQNKATHATVLNLVLDNFWGASLLGAGDSFDPRIYYDPYGKRWILVAVSCTSTFTASKILIAVSKTSNPTGTWYKFAVDVQSGSNWLDYPTVGFNKKWITVSGNYFTAGGSSVNSAIWCFDKTTIYTGSSAPFQSFTNVGNFTICPAVTYNANLSSMFLLAIFNRNASSGGQLILRKITGPVGSATLSGAVGYPSANSLPTGVNRWAQGANSGNDFAPQAGSSQKVQTNDDRITNLTFRNNRLWTAHTVFFPSSGATRSSIMWWQMDTTGTPNQVGLIDGTNQFYAFPSIAVNAANDALVGYSYFSATTYPSAGYSLRLSTDPLDSMRKPFIYRHGLKYYYQTFGGSKNRFGDYSATCVDPSNDMDLWAVQESVPAWTSTSIWDTWWAKVKTGTTNTSVAVSQMDDIKTTGVNIVPNPNDGAFRLVFDKDIDETVTINIMNMEGRLMYSKAHDVKSNSVTIETTTLPTGNYILNTVVEGTTISRKVTITR